MDAYSTSSPGPVIRARSLRWVFLQQRSWDICAFLLAGTVVSWACGYGILALVLLIGACVIAITMTGIYLMGVLAEIAAGETSLREVTSILGLILLVVVVALASLGLTTAAALVFCTALGTALLHLARHIPEDARHDGHSFDDGLSDDVPQSFQ